MPSVVHCLHHGDGRGRDKRPADKFPAWPSPARRSALHKLHVPSQVSELSALVASEQDPAKSLEGGGTGNKQARCLSLTMGSMGPWKTERTGGKKGGNLMPDGQKKNRRTSIHLHLALRRLHLIQQNLRCPTLREKTVGQLPGDLRGQHSLHVPFQQEAKF